MQQPKMKQEQAITSATGMTAETGAPMDYIEHRKFQGFSKLKERPD